MLRLLLLTIFLSYTCSLRLGNARSLATHSRSVHRRINLSLFLNTASPNTDIQQSDEEELVKRINLEVLAESGVELEQLINPSKVVNLERDLVALRASLAAATSEKERLDIEKKISKKEKILFVEKRAVFRGWLKNLFLGQSIVAGVASLGMVYDCIPGLPVPLPVQVLGFWMWWLFIIPSLRARKPVEQEKTALNIAFLATPIVSLAMPVFTKDIPVIWWGNAVVTFLCYLYAFARPANDDTTGGQSEDDEEGEAKTSSFRRLLIKAAKALDYGSGQERGLRQ